MPNPKGPREKTEAFMRNDTGAQELYEMLRADAPQSDAFDAELTARIAEVMSKQENNETGGAFRDPQQAWQDFETNYLPRLEESENHRGAEYCTDARTASTGPKGPGKGRVLRLAAAMAAAAACLVLTISAGARANGFDLWGTFERWTEETFGFKSSGLEQGHSGGDEVPEQLAELKLYMDKYGVTAGALPTYLPEGYETTDVQCIPTMETIEFICCLLNGEETIAMHYTLHLTTTFPSTMEKDNLIPEETKINGMTYYVMTNADDYRASWVTDRVECNIFGVTSKDELLKILGSIK